MALLFRFIDGGGSETTATTLQWFFFVLVRYPEVQLKAQEEIDRVVGFGDRLPDLSEYEFPNLAELLTNRFRIEAEINYRTWKR